MSSESNAPRPTYTFTLGSTADIADFVSVYIATFQDAAYDALFPKRLSDPAGHLAYQISRHLATLKTPGMEWAKVSRADTGEVVAVGKWCFCDGQPEPPSPTGNPGGWDGVNEEFYREFFQPMEEMHEKLMGERPHYIVHILATLPEYQGRGAISPIIRHVLGLARERNVPIYIESTPMGLPVYKHFGWREVGRIPVNLPSGEPFPDTVVLVNETTVTGV